MTVHIDMAWLMSLWLSTIRMTALLLLTPILGGANVPAQARLALLLGLGATLMAALPAAHQLAATPGLDALWPLAVSELVLGAAMAFGLHCAFGSFSLAGKMLDLQIGFSVGSIFDPVTRTAVPLLGALLSSLGVVVFYAMEGHHLLLRMMAYSFAKVPVGTTLPWQMAGPFVDQFGAMFVLGLTLAAPVVVALFLVDVGLGIVSRTMPQMNVFLVGLIVKIMVGLLIFMLSLQGMVAVMRRIFDAVFLFWQQLLA